MGQVDGFAFGEGRPRLRPGLRVTHLGDERLVLDPASGVVHTVRGPAVGELDRVLAGSSATDAEILTALAARGIVEVGGLSRRRALALSGSALMMVVSSSLPSAIAAASTLAFTSDGSGSVTTYTLGDGSTLYRGIQGSISTSDVEFTLNVGPTAQDVEVVLVGGGGPGGDRISGSARFLGGGGGGGEVIFAQFGTVPASTQLRFTIGGFGASGFSSVARGRSSTVEEVTGPSSSNLLVTALGGGRGGRFDPFDEVFDAAETGGSGGGGSSESTSGIAGTSSGAGSGSFSVTVTSSVGDGAAGVSLAGGGGGGSSGNGFSGTGSTGGDGGSGTALGSVATDWDFTGSGSGVPQPTLGAGGGGAGEDAGGSSSGGGAGGFFDSTARAGDEGDIGSGGGGGGGMMPASGTGANAGRGASGSAWIRVSEPA